MSVSRRIARYPREPVPDTRREHGVGRYRGGAARRGVRALGSQKQDFSTARSRPNRSAVGIPRGCPPYRVASYARAMLSHARARPIRPIVRGVGGECASRRAFFPRVGDDIGTCCVNPFQGRPRTRRRCLTPHAVMNPAAYPDNRWSTGSHTSSGASPVTQRCDSPSVAPSSSLLHPPPTRQYSQHAGALFRGQRQRTPRGGRPAVARRPDRAAHPTNIAGKHSTTGSTCSASYSRCAAPVHAPSPVKKFAHPSVPSSRKLFSSKIKPLIRLLLDHPIHRRWR